MEKTKSIKNFSLVKNICFAFLATLILAISAKIKIPFYPVPMTMQTFVVLLVGIYFGWRLGMFTVGLYLIEGMVGLPVFAGTPEKGIGIAYFIGPTMGYLVGFLIAVFLAGFFKFENSFFKNFLKLVFSVSFIYLFGIIWLWFFKGLSTNFNEIFAIGAKPFLLIELYKLLILAVLSNLIFKIRPFI